MKTPPPDPAGKSARPELYPVVPLHGEGPQLRPKTAGRFRHEYHHVYAEAHGAALFMDVFHPPRPNGLGIIDVVSTAWHSGRAQIYEHLGLGIYDTLCDQGYTVFALCPGSATQYTALQLAQHVRAGIRYIKARHETWQIAPHRLGLFGASAGGHLAALAALQPEDPHLATRNPFLKLDTRVAAVALFFAPADLLDFWGQPLVVEVIAGRPVPKLIFEDGISSHSPEEIRTRLREISPAHLVIQSPPPCLLFHGDADPLVPLEQSERLVDHLRSAGGSVKLRVKAGGGHPWPNIAAEAREAGEWFRELL
jgi:acetyl esterase/lipase